MTIFCRNATQADLPVLSEFQQRIISAEADYIPRRVAHAYQYYNLADLLEDPSTRIAVAETQAQVIGSGYVQLRASKAYLRHAYHGYVGFMYTKPAFRRQGVAQQILQFLGQWVRQQGYDELRLEVFANNSRAIRAYQAAGFEPNIVEMRYHLHED